MRNISYVKMRITETTQNLDIPRSNCANIQFNLDYNRSAVLRALRYPRNRSCLHVLVFVLLVSWISLLVSASCAMPSTWRVSPADAMPVGCSGQDGHAPMHPGHHPQPVQDCSLKPCAESLSKPVYGFKSNNPEMPIILLCLIWLVGDWLSSHPNPRTPRADSPPDGRRVLLIYRFCTLLN
jgi:hypothetical protein